MFVFPFVLQHRMRPEIARLLTPHIYSELENHPSVYEYDNIKVHIGLALLLSLFSVFIASEYLFTCLHVKKDLHYVLDF